MWIVNFSHPLTLAQCEQVAARCGEPVRRVVDVPTQLDPETDFAPQVRALLRSVPLSPSEWQEPSLVVSLPAFAPIAALVLAWLHGLRGHFPTCLRLRAANGRGGVTYEVAELLNPQAEREEARQWR